MTGKTWFIIRLALYAVVVAATFFAYRESSPPLPPASGAGLWMFIAFYLAVLFMTPTLVLGLMLLLYALPWTASRWTRPTHGSNPFDLRSPLQFFHFGVYLEAAQGAAMLIASLWREPALALHGAYLLAAAAMLYLGVRLTMVVFSAKMAEPAGKRNANET
jgi:hypothetical protein